MQLGPLFRLLRADLLRFAALFSAWFVCAWAWRDTLTHAARWPLDVAASSESSTVLLKVFDLFFVHLKLSLAAALALSLPPVLLRLGRVVGTLAPALGRDRLPRLVSGFLLLYYAGAAAMATLALPALLRLLATISLGGEPLLLPAENALASVDRLTISLAEYVDFVVATVAFGGLALTIPPLVLAFVALGRLNPRHPGPARGAWYVAFAALAALLTPSDPVTLVLLLAPLIVLFEFGLLLARLFVPRRHWPPPPDEGV